MSDPASSFQTLVEVTKVGGPYTVIVALAWSVRYLYLSRERDKEKYDEDKQKLNDRIVRVIEAQNQALTLAMSSQNRQGDMLGQAMLNQQALIEMMKKRGH